MSNIQSRFFKSMIIHVSDLANLDDQTGCFGTLMVNVYNRANIND